jgi:TetR/AcrR family transcriptional regulator, transcriptional repressor for nem operon
MARPRKFDDTDVLDRATDLFWKHGSAAVSIRDLEVALELKAPSIYRRFDSKDQLLVRCLDRYVEQAVGGRVRFFLDDTDDPLGGLRAFFTSVLEPHPGEGHVRGCLLTTTSTHAEATAPEIRSAIDRGFATIEAAFARQIGRAVDAGQLDNGIDSHALAKALLMSFQGLLVLASAGASDLQASIDATFDIQPRSNQTQGVPT